MIGYGILALWAAFAIYWIKSAPAAKAPITDAGHPWFLLPLLICGQLLVMPISSVPLIAFPVTGLVLTMIGLGYAAWARHVLGTNWAGDITIQYHHELVTTGPYSQHRHPIYCGILIAYIGAALYIGELHAYAAPFFGLTAFVMKARREEALLADNFPEYRAYRAGTFW